MCSLLNESELNAFVITCNGEPFNAATLQEVMESFDCDDQGRMTLVGFEEMFHLQSTSEPEATAKDMEKLGYRLTKDSIAPAAAAPKE